MPREPGYGSKRSQDGEAQRTCRERWPGTDPPKADWSGHRERPATGHGQPRPASRARFKWDAYQGRESVGGAGVGRFRATTSVCMPAKPSIQSTISNIPDQVERT